MTAMIDTRAAGFGGTFARLAARFAAWRRREAAVAATLRELEALTDRELADIGFVRADLARVARDAH